MPPVRVDPILEPPLLVDRPFYERLLAADVEDFIGRSHSVLPDGGDLEPDRSLTHFFVPYATLPDGLIQVGVDAHDEVCARTPDGRRIGEYVGPSLVVAREFRGRGVGRLLVALRAILEGGVNPQAGCDEVGYTAGGLAASLSGFALAKRIAAVQLSRMPAVRPPSRTPSFR